MSTSQEIPTTTPTGPTIAVIGGGIAGVTLVTGLVKRGINVKLYEQAPSFAEIGAGVALGPNAARAMEAIGGGVKAAFEKVCTGNMDANKADVWFDFVDGFHANKEDGKDQEKWLFRQTGATGGGGVHRAHFLEELIKLVPDKVAVFNKHLDTCVEQSDGRLELRFHDGTTAKYDAVIGCDGIKSRVRSLLVGDGAPSAMPTYCHKYAYRGLIPMDKAAEILGNDMARNAHMHLGPRGHILTFPVAHGKTMNVVAFRQDDSEWSDKRLTAPASKKDALKDFQDWHPRVTDMLEMLDDDLDRWAIFDLDSHPLDTYYTGRVCLLGDAAHATSPHHGAGAGFCIEDSAVMSELLDLACSKFNVPPYTALEAAFAAFDRSRRERTQWLVQSSRRVGNMYDWMDEGVGDDKEKIRAELDKRCKHIWNGDITAFIKEAREDLEGQLTD